MVVVENMSLDGVAQSPGRADEDPRDGFQRGGWASTWFATDPEAARAAMGGRHETTALLFGSRTYLDLVGHWLSTPGPNPFADILRSMPKHVVTSTLPDPLPHPNSHALRGDPAVTVARLKDEAAGEIVVLGSIRLVHALTAAGLVDEYLLTVLPVVLGGGLRLFDTVPVELETVSSSTSPRGAVTATYRPVRRGS
nr:dihydrofolate reductase family protein [Motilibacter aurantiacus]